MPPASGRSAFPMSFGATADLGQTRVSQAFAAPSPLTSARALSHTRAHARTLTPSCVHTHSHPLPQAPPFLAVFERRSLLFSARCLSPFCANAGKHARAHTRMRARSCWTSACVQVHFGPGSACVCVSTMRVGIDARACLHRCVWGASILVWQSEHAGSNLNAHHV
eukprot:3900747-Pleurochrysis_carterae.AAC.3